MKDIRILVEGSRGKSGLVKSLTDLLYSRGEDAVGKVTGKETVVFRNGQKLIVERKNGKNFLIDHENKKIMRKYSDVKFKIFENQALSCYTMKIVHLIVKPQIIVIPNIRFEHQDRLGENLFEIARSFAHNFKGAEKVITTENKKEVLKIFREYCNKFKTKLIVVDSSQEVIPSISSIDLLDNILNELDKSPLSLNEKRKLKNSTLESMGLKYSKSQRIKYFYGSKVNDIESSTKVFAHLKKIYPGKKFVFLCYLRGDRPERTESFLPFFEKIYHDYKVERIYFTGSGLGHIKNHHKVIKKKDLTYEEVIEFCRKKNLVLFTAVNGVNKFIQKLEKVLEE